MGCVLLFLSFLLIYSVSSKAITLNRNDSVDTNPAMKKLLQVFGVIDHQSTRNLQPPPQYMLDLYNSIADESGVTKAPNPFNSTIIRSFAEKEHLQNNHFSFNISGLERSENVLEAEFHLYRTRKSEEIHLHSMSIYQVLDTKWMNEPYKNRLVDIRYINGSFDGWQIFRVKSAVNEWIANPVTNLGFLVIATSISGQSVPLYTSRRTDRQRNRQPLLVLFNHDGSSMEAKINSHGLDDNISTEVERTRHRREIPTSNYSFPRTFECHRRELYVDFESIGWSEWIIAPKGYNAYHCSGVCSFPLGQSQKPTNHATVQSIVHEMKLVDGVSRPCCVPSRLLALSLLYYDDNDNVVLKQYGDMVAESCGCH